MTRASLRPPLTATGRSAPPPAVAEVTRRDVRTTTEHVESVHAAHAVVVGPDGRVVAALGDPHHVTFARSAVKPFQAAAALGLVTGAGVAVPGGPELAVAWASHRGEPAQLAAVRTLLARSGTPEAALTCPPAAPEADPGAVPTRLQHNCSGKHALFALAGRQLGLGGPALLDPDGPLQRAVLDHLAVRLGPLLAVGVDGCGAPAVAVHLSGVAGAFADLAVGADLAPIRAAGLAHPALVGGEGRLETALLAAGVVAKVGAEGVYGVGWIDPYGRPWGYAITAVDGSIRGVGAATAAVLTAAGVIPPGTWRPPPPLGGGHPAGEVRVTGAVHTLAAEVAAAITPA